MGYYSCKFEQSARQTTTRIALLLRKKWKLFAYATTFVMLIVLYPSAMTAIRRRLPGPVSAVSSAPKPVSPAASTVSSVPKVTHEKTVKNLMENPTFKKELKAIL